MSCLLYTDTHWMSIKTPTSTEKRPKKGAQACVWKWWMAAWVEWIGSAPGHGGTAGAADGCSCAVLGLGAAVWHLGKLDLLPIP